MQLCVDRQFLEDGGVAVANSVMPHNLAMDFLIVYVVFCAGFSKAPAEKDFLTWQPDLEHDDNSTIQDRPTVFRWTGAGKEVFVSGSFNSWATKIPLIRRCGMGGQLGLLLPQQQSSCKFVGSNPQEGD